MTMPTVYGPEGFRKVANMRSEQEGWDTFDFALPQGWVDEYMDKNGEFPYGYVWAYPKGNVWGEPVKVANVEG